MSQKKNIFVMFRNANAIKCHYWCDLSFPPVVKLSILQSGDLVLQQYFQLPDSITPTHLTFWSPDKYLCSTAVPIHPNKKNVLGNICSAKEKKMC